MQGPACHFFKHCFLPLCIFRPMAVVIYSQPQVQHLSFFPAIAVVVSFTLVVKLIINSVPVLFTMLSANMPSSIPGLADSGGIFSFGILNGPVVYSFVKTV